MAGVIEAAAGLAPPAVDAGAEGAGGEAVGEAGAGLRDEVFELLIGFAGPAIGVLEQIVGDGFAPGGLAVLTGAGDVVAIEINRRMRGASVDGELRCGGAGRGGERGGGE